MVWGEMPKGSPVGSNGGFCLLELMKMCVVGILSVACVVKLVRRG